VYAPDEKAALYRVTAPTTIPNSQPRFNVYPTGPVDTAVAHHGARELVEMRQPGVFHFNWFASDERGLSGSICARSLINVTSYQSRSRQLPR